MEFDALSGAFLWIGGRKKNGYSFRNSSKFQTAQSEITSKHEVKIEICCTYVVPDIKKPRG